MIRLGDRVEHKLNGLRGIASGRTEYMNGCRQFLIQQEKLDKDGKGIEGVWYDEQWLTVVDEQVLKDPFISGQPAYAGGPDRSERSTH